MMTIFLCNIYNSAYVVHFLQQLFTVGDWNFYTLFMKTLTVI